MSIISLKGPVRKHNQGNYRHFPCPNPTPARFSQTLLIPYSAHSTLSLKSCELQKTGLSVNVGPTDTLVRRAAAGRQPSERSGLVTEMLQKNQLQPPRPFAHQLRTPAAVEAKPAFVSAEDFDATGILTGIDTCASAYWWMPELEGSAPQSPAVRDDSRLAAALQRRRRVADQATIRPVSRPTAAA
jgi:hypothetical protein